MASLLALCACDSEKSGGDNLDRKLASRVSSSYRDNALRLKAISEELNTHPIPYRGEPTGTGGFLAWWLSDPKKKIELVFEWDKERAIDSVALFPLRLYLSNGGYCTENAYWPETIEILATTDGKLVSLATLRDTQKSIRRSLPEFVEFDAIETSKLTIVCTDLTKETAFPQYSAGFSEIFIFSGQENIAPLAKIGGNRAREDKRTLATEYLIDEQTPLGLPELPSKRHADLGIFFPTIKRIPKKPYVCELTFPAPTPIDAVRLDPAIIHRPGQSFPVRFSIDLLDKNRHILKSNTTYADEPFVNPGLNPYIAHFDKTSVSAIRLNVYEATKPTPRSTPIIQLSEITPMLRGVPLKIEADFRRSTITPIRESQKFEDTGIQRFWTMESIHDGMTQSGVVISQRDWVSGLHARQKLLEENAALEDAQLRISHMSGLTAVWGATAFIIAVIIAAAAVIIRSRLRMHKEVQAIRERIASDLHDETGSNLAVIALHASQLRDNITEPAVYEKLNAIFRLSRESIFGLREVLHAATPAVGRPQNIANYMEELAVLILVGIPFEFDATTFTRQGEKLSPQLRKDLIMFYKEALNNCRRHAGCTLVKIRISTESNQLTIEVEDDGIGMSAEKLNKPQTLRTIKQRAARLGANLDLRSEESGGLYLCLKTRIQ
ncbi:MAG: histidine kinase [Luteolibacter sp.]